MAISLTLSIQLSGNGTVKTSERVCTNTGNPRVSDVVPIGASAFEVGTGITYATMTLLAIFSDQDLTLSPKTSADGSAGADIDVGPDNAYVWQSDSSLANPFTADVAYFAVANASGVEANLTIEPLVDATP